MSDTPEHRTAARSAHDVQTPHDGGDRVVDDAPVTAALASPTAAAAPAATAAAGESVFGGVGRGSRADAGPDVETAVGDQTTTDVETVVGDDTVTIHRAPRYLRFMIAGGVVGVVVALILTFSFPEPAGFDFSQVFGFLALFCGVVGFALGAVVALLVDRASRRAAKTIVVERVEGGEELDGQTSDD
ncbi:hypothetical protein [Subtercola endophyticus]|uniref:hypothetical protein n=1 Tax=Subtercola endophyticus TaxID=2895559 RepID=UPI001E38870E|nr:hypothetical protein [Subtercola endophyticus]UFS58956.1 hypothetical protein LQ955_18500 [Subtercola endophyticus]